MGSEEERGMNEVLNRGREANGMAPLGTGASILSTASGHLCTPTLLPTMEGEHGQRKSQKQQNTCSGYFEYASTATQMQHGTMVGS